MSKWFYILLLKTGYYTQEEGLSHEDMFQDVPDSNTKSTNNELVSLLREICKLNSKYMYDMYRYNDCCIMIYTQTCFLFLASGSDQQFFGHFRAASCL